MGCATGTRPLSNPVTVDLGNVRIHLVTSASELPEQLGVARLGAMGAAWTRGMQCDLYAFATEDDAGQIFVSEFVLGHELRHLLEHKNKRFYVWD